MANQTTGSKKKSIILAIITGSIVLLLLLIVLLPTLISTDWAADTVKKEINSRIPGQVDFETFSLGWTGPIQCQGISYNNTANGVSVKLASLTISKSLSALALDYKKLGTISIEDPLVKLALKNKTGTGKPETTPPSSNQPAATSRADVSGQNDSDAYAIPPFEGQLLVSGGAVHAILDEKTDMTVMQDLNLDVRLSRIDQLMDYRLSFLSGDKSGKVEGLGSVALPTGDITNLGAIESQAELNIAKWEVADLLTILANMIDMPKGSGQLNGRINISGSNDMALNVKGNLTADTINLHGGPLKSDTPSLDKVAIEVDAVKKGSVLTINELRLSSPLATGKVSGEVGENNRREIVSEAVVDLAEIFTQFPSTLNLKKGVSISTGKISLEAKINTTDAITAFDGNAKLDQLQGKAENKKIAWDKPISVELKGRHGRQGVFLENFTLHSSFLTGKGHGDLNGMEANLTADLGTALGEVEKFIQVKEWKTDGKMNLDLKIDSKDETVKKLTGDLTLENFELRQKNRIIAPKKKLKAKLTTDIHLDKDMAVKEIRGTALDIQSWLGQAGMTLKNLRPASEKVAMSVNEFQVTGSIALPPVADLLMTLDLLPRDTELSGATNIKTSLSIQGDELNLHGTDIEITDLIYRHAKEKVSEKKIRLTARGGTNLKEKTISLKPVNLKTTAAEFAFPQLVIKDWSKVESSLKTDGSINLNLDLLATQLHALKKLPPDTRVKGMATFSLGVDLAASKEQSIHLSGNIEPVEIKSQSKTLLSEKSITLGVDIKGDIGKQDFSVTKLDFTSVPLALNGTATLKPQQKERILTGEGSLNLDLPVLSRYLKSIYDIDLEMKGGRQEPFHIKMESTNGKWTELQKKTELSTSFHADMIKGFGLHIELLQLPLELRDALAKIDIRGTVNRGKMAISPTIDFSHKSPLITLPQNSLLLSKVGLTEKVSRDLLAKTHPIFTGAAVSRGTVDLAMAHLSWPLDSENRSEGSLAGSVTFHDVRLTAGGLMIPLLEAMKEKDREISLGNKPMEFYSENERVHCSPLEIKVKEHQLLLSGSVGYDQSLDYKAQIPVTRKMVSGDVYKYLEGTFISVPIGGTVSKPTVSKNFIQIALSDLIKQAAKKQVTDQAGQLLQQLFK